MKGFENVDGPSILAYGDIMFNEKIVSELIQNEDDIVIASIRLINITNMM